jgi:tRNA1(Val) A37 N6-methylase TrmN6
MCSVSSDDSFFKGWAKPGPRALQGVAAEPGETLDAISGHYRLFQLREGHRFSTDDLLVAWYGTSWCPSATSILELGSGIGTVGMIAAWRLPGAKLVAIEAQEQSVALARKSASYNGIEERYDLRCSDFRAPEILREEEKFDLVLGSPPYFPLDAGLHGDHPQKVACRFEVRGTIADYCAVAAKHLGLGGVFACVFPVQPEQQAARVEEAARDADLVILRRRDVVLKEGLSPLLGLFLMMRRDHLPANVCQKTWREPDLVIRTATGQVHPEYSLVKMSIGFPP